MTTYIKCSDTAKLIRKQLKAAFPGQKFSVRSHTYSGGASIHIGWTDGPFERDVKQITDRFAGGRFDGMIDLAYSAESYLCEEHGVGFYRTYGHSYDDAADVNAPCCLKAEVVHFHSDYVFTDREISEEYAASFEPLVTQVLSSYTQCKSCGKFGQGEDGFVVDVQDWRGGFNTWQSVCSVKCGAKVIAHNGVAAEEVEV